MLVLTRRVGESIVIGDNITVTVLEVKGDQIRIGISAPREVPVYREEIVVALREANQSAVFSPEAGAKLPVPARDRTRRRGVA